MTTHRNDIRDSNVSSPDVIDSSATTLLASPSSSSSGHDAEIKYHDDELKDYGSSEDDEEEEDDREQGRLLGRDEIPAPTDALPIEEEERHEPAEALQDTVKEKAGPVSWSALPRKDQLAILTLARLSEPLTQTSLQSYMFYQLKSFNPDALDSTISYQTGMLAAGFTGAQFCTAILWGRMADSEKMGRKKVILIGLLGTAIGALGFGFSSSFAVAFFWRAVGGALNGNIGVMRTMISEIVREKKFQSRAFLLMPMTFNIGVIIGPILGGLLADPVGSYPGLFGAGSVFGGKDGVYWMQKWPYALPNLVSATFLAFSALALVLCLEESHEMLRDKPDFGITIRNWILRIIFRRGTSQKYHAVGNHGAMGLGIRSEDMEMRSQPAPSPPKRRRKLPFRRIWTRNVLAVLLAHAMLACHVGTFNNLWFVFLSTPRYNPAPISANGTDSNPSLRLPSDYHPHGLFTFTGGLALPPPKIGQALAILGVIGISLQLLIYPPLSFRLGTARSYRLSLSLFPLTYTLVPFLAIVATSSLPPAPASGIWFWLYMILVLSCQVLGRTFALPATAILVNNASPHPSVLGTIHGIGQSVSSAMRTFGPVVGGYVYGLGLRMGVVGLVWWSMAAWAVVGAAAGLLVREGDGHEIWLEGEREEYEEEMRDKGGG